MDKLREEIEKRRKTLTGNGWVRRADVEKQRESEYLEQQAEREKQRNEAISRSKVTEVSTAETPKPSLELSKEEVIARLRNVGEPARLFAESFSQQCERLKSAERRIAEQGPLTPQPSISNHQSREKVYIDSLETEGEGLDTAEEIYRDSELLRDAVEWDEYEDRGEIYRKHREHPLKLEVKGLSYMTKVGFLYRWIREMMNVWEEEIADLATKPDFNHSQQQKKLKETKQALKSLIRLFKQQELREDIPNAFFLVARFCQIRSYIKAHDHYLALSTGKIPWTTEKPDPRHRGGMITSK